MDTSSEDRLVDKLRPLSHNGKSHNNPTIQSHSILTVWIGESIPALIKQESTNLKLNLKISSFSHLVKVIKYCGFLKVLEICNGTLKPHMRGTIELMWSNLIQQELKTMISHHISDGTKQY